jgi:hypothetical protein
LGLPIKPLADGLCERLVERDGRASCVSHSPREKPKLRFAGRPRLLLGHNRLDRLDCNDEIFVCELDKEVRRRRRLEFTFWEGHDALRHQPHRLRPLVTPLLVTCHSNRRTGKSRQN